MDRRQLNFGCGARFCKTWTNIDFHASDPSVQRVNLLRGFPFPECCFDTVYSSHVLEHFDLDQGRFLMSESYRVLRKGGILRIVVPDLEGSCREYIRILSLKDGPEKQQLYSWVILELLDQLVRVRRTGRMGTYLASLQRDDNLRMQAYVQSRTQNNAFDEQATSGVFKRLKSITPDKLRIKLLYMYLRALAYLVPQSIRDIVLVRSDIGERHQWMYDGFSLKQLFEETGFTKVTRRSFDESGIIGFTSSFLDSFPDGRPYKCNSIYMEGIK